MARICLLCFFYRSVFQEIIGTHHANLSRDLELIHPNNNLLELSMKSCVCIYVYSKHIIAYQRIAHAAKRRIVSCSLSHFPGKQSTIFTIKRKHNNWCREPTVFCSASSFKQWTLYQLRLGSKAIAGLYPAGLWGFSLDGVSHDFVVVWNVHLQEIYRIYRTYIYKYSDKYGQIRNISCLHNINIKEWMENNFWPTGKGTHNKIDGI